MSKYKLCLVDLYQKSEVFPINEKGEQYGNMLNSYEYDDENHYAIYENVGDEQDEDWEEWGYYGTDFDNALTQYRILKEREEKQQ